MNKVRVGIIGTGGIANSHVNGIARHPGAEVVAAADIDFDRAAAFAKRHELARAYGSADELLADPDIDAVSIGTPNKFHAPIALAALRAGKHVHLDKPFALNAREAKQVLDTAKRKGLVFMLGMNQRFSANAQTVRGLVGKGAIGEVYHAKAYWLRRAGIPGWGSWFCSKELAGGGGMLDIGVHLLDLSLHLIDNFEPVAVTAATYTKLGHRGLGFSGLPKGATPPPFDVDDFATAFIRMKNGATVSLEASWALHMSDPNRHDVEIFGTEGGLRLNPIKLFKFGRRPGEYVTTDVPRAGRLAYPPGCRFHHWMDVVLGKAEPMCRGDEALTVQKILDGIYKSSETGREVRIR